MLKKALAKSGIRILKAIKKLSTKTYVSSKKKSSHTAAISNCAGENEAAVEKISKGNNSWRSALPNHEAVSLSWSMMSLDTKSIDTYVTMISENVLDNSSDFNEDEEKCCCCCAEYEENQRNENKENEMFGCYDTLVLTNGRPPREQDSSVLQNSINRNKIFGIIASILAESG